MHPVQAKSVSALTLLCSSTLHTLVFTTAHVSFISQFANLQTFLCAEPFIAFHVNAQPALMLLKANMLMPPWHELGKSKLHYWSSDFVKITKLVIVQI